MAKLYFKGRKMNQQKGKPKDSNNISSYVNKKLSKSIDISAIMQEELILLNTVTGMLFGPHSVSFKQYKRIK